MAPKLLSHHREQFCGIILLSLAGKPDHQCEAHYRRWYALFDALDRRPATLAGVGNEGFHVHELLIPAKYIGGQIE